jgi:hypothetical protein
LKIWTVEIPIAGSIAYTVEAESKAKAIDKAWEAFNAGEEPENTEWEALSYITKGNVCSAPVNNISATEVKCQQSENP